MTDGPVQDDLFGAPLPPSDEGLFDAQLALPLSAAAAPEPFAAIVKRDGRVERFDRRKIGEAILRASPAAQAADRARADSLAAAVAIYLFKRLGNRAPTADQVNDAVERVLIHMQEPDTALAFARHRDRRARIRRLRAGDVRLLAGELDEAQRARDALRAHGDRALFVRTSGDAIAAWDRERIVAALVRETGLAEAMARMVALEVEDQIGRAGLRVLTTALVRELVGAKLIERGLEAHHARHRRLGLPLYDAERIVQGAAPEGEGHDPAATDRVLARAVKKEYALAEVFPAEVSEAHLRGDLHLHALDAVDRVLSAEHALDCVTVLGVGVAGGLRFADPPQRADALLAQWVMCADAYARHCAGTVGWDAVNFGMAPFVYGLPEPALEHIAQAIVGEFAFRALAQPHAAPAAITLCWSTPPWLSGREAMGPGGAPTDKVYDDYEHTAQQLAWALVTAVERGGPGGLAYPGPRLRIQVSEASLRAPGGEAFLLHAGRPAAARRAVEFVLDRRPRAIRDHEETWQPQQLLLHQVTLNLPRAAYAAGRADELPMALETVLQCAVRAHAAKRDFLLRLLGRGAAGPLGMLKRERGGAAYFDPHAAWCAVGIEGLHEALAYLTRGADDPRDAMQALGRQTLSFLAERCRALGRKHDLRLGLAQNNHAPAGARFAQRDLEAYPEAALSTLRIEDGAGDPAYTRGACWPADPAMSPIERARLEGEWHPMLRFGARTTVPRPDAALSENSIADFLKKVWRQTANRRIVFE